jgi:hypothetical protein
VRFPTIVTLEKGAFWTHLTFKAVAEAPCQKQKMEILIFKPTILFVSCNHYEMWLFWLKIGHFVKKIKNKAICKPFNKFNGKM